MGTNVAWPTILIALLLTQLLFVHAVVSQVLTVSVTDLEGTAMNRLGDSYYGSSLQLSQNGSALAIGSPQPPSSPYASLLGLLRVQPSSTLKYDEAYNQLLVENNTKGYFGASVSTDGILTVSGYYDDTNATAEWAFSVGMVSGFQGGGGLANCTKNMTLSVATSNNVLLFGCGDTTGNPSLLFEYRRRLIDNTPLIYLANRTIVQIPQVFDLHITQLDDNNLLICSTSIGSLLVQTLEISTDAFANLFQSYGSSRPEIMPYWQIDCWQYSIIYALPSPGANESIVKFVPDIREPNKIIDLLINTSEIITDVAVGDGIAAAVSANSGKLFIFSNLSWTLESPSAEPCIIVTQPWQGSPIELMAVDISSTPGRDLIAVSYISPDESRSQTYVLINPCGAPNITSYTTDCASNLYTSIGTQALCQSGGDWTVAGNVTNGDDIIIGSQDRITISGDLTLSSSYSLKLFVDENDDRNQSIVTTLGSAQIGGAIEVQVLNQLTVDPFEVNLVSASSIQGSFSSITVVSPTGAKCNYRATPKYTSTQVLLNLQSSCGKGGKSKKTIIIAVVVSIGGIILISIIVLAVMIALKRRGKMIKIFWSQHGQQSRDTL